MSATTVTPTRPAAPASAASAARAVNVTKIYGTGDAAVHALDDVTASLSAGQFTAIMGPSGSGKSTLLHVLAGLDRPTSGEVYVGDTEISGLNDKQLTLLRRDQIGFIFQAFNLLPTLTAAENIELPIRIAGRKPDALWVRSVVELVGLCDRLRHRPAELSGGQQQRVAAARALASKPQIVFADEPTGALDSRAGAELLEFLQGAVRNGGQTVVMVTHDPVAASYADRVLFLADGRIVDEMTDPTAHAVFDYMKHLGLINVFTATIRGMLAHKLRVILTTVSIALGVAFLSGTLILTDTMNGAFNTFFGQVSSGTDAVVRHETAYTAASGASVSRAPIPASVLSSVRQVPGVAVAEGVDSGYALMTDTQGKAVLPSGGAPTMGYTMTDDVTLRGDIHLLTGHAPVGAHEVAIDATSAAHHDIPLGSSIRILFRGPSQMFTVVGTVGFGREKSFGGTSSAYFASATAQRVLGTPGAFDEIDVRSTGDISDTTLAARLNAVVPTGVQAVTGAAAAREAADTIKHIFSFVGVLFTIFAAIALFVGSFIIWNTFTMIVSQRTREIALTRAVGATRRQVLTSLLTEAAVLGVVASALGIALGIGVAKGLNALMSALGFSLPTAAMQINPRTIWVSMIVGILVTVAAALVPSRRATKVLPVEALRDAVPGADAPSKLRGVIGGVLTVGGVVAIVASLHGNHGRSGVLFGMLATIVGVITVAPLAARPLAAVIGAPMRVRGLSGDLARQNAMRNPRRTASTATALMIGLALVIGMGVLAASLKASFGTVLHDSTNATLYVTPASGQGGGFSPDVVGLVRAVPGVAAVSATGVGEARFDGTSSTYSSVDPATVGRAINLKMTSGSAATLGTDGVLVRGSVARSQGWHIGQQIGVTFPATGSRVLTVKGLFDGTGYLDGNYLISQATEEASVPDRLDAGVLVMVNQGANQSVVKAAIAKVLATHPDAKVLDRSGYAKEIGGLVDQLLALVSVMLLLSVIIAFLGIVNTLALSVYERTRELGLLRAVGMTQAQVRAMVRWESVLISLIGAVIGAGLGIGLGAALAQSLKGDGVTRLVIPGGQVALYVVAAAIAGVLAAIGPGRSAARVDVLKAVVAD